MTDIETGNTIIAKFMGFELKEQGAWIRDKYLPAWIAPEDTTIFIADSEPVAGHGCTLFLSNQLKFNEDWNWLIAACYKFDNLNRDDYPKELHEAKQEAHNHLDQAMCLYEIFTVFDTLVKAIQWHNSTTPKKD